MGFQAEFNWMLKLASVDIASLGVGEVYTFTKNGVRFYPINTPIDLVNGNWEALAQCVVERVTIDATKTCGEYRVLEIYGEEKKRVLSDHWRSLLQYVTGVGEIDDYSKIHIT